MSAAEVLATCRARGVSLWRDGDRIGYLAASAADLSDGLVERLRAAKPELMAMLPDRYMRPVLYFALPDYAPGAVATALGLPGQTPIELVASLRERWPSVRILPRPKS